MDLVGSSKRKLILTEEEPDENIPDFRSGEILEDLAYLNTKTPTVSTFQMGLGVVSADSKSNIKGRDKTGWSWKKSS